MGDIWLTNQVDINKRTTFLVIFCQSCPAIVDILTAEGTWASRDGGRKASPVRATFSLDKRVPHLSKSLGV